MSTHNTDAYLDDSIINETPRVPLMKLMYIKTIHGSTSSNNQNPQPHNNMNDVLSSPSEFNKDTMQIIKAVFKKPEILQIDTPCEPEDEDEDNIKAEETVSAPILNHDNLKKDNTILEDEKKRKDEVDHKESSNKQNNRGSQINRNKKVLMAQKNLMDALFNSNVCKYCKKSLISTADSFRNTCGHLFHSNCSKQIASCSECGKEISFY